MFSSLDGIAVLHGLLKNYEFPYKRRIARAQKNTNNGVRRLTLHPFRLVVSAQAHGATKERENTFMPSGSSNSSSSGGSSTAPSSSGSSTAPSSGGSSTAPSSNISSNTPSSGSSGSSHRIIKLGFYGAGATTDAGNSWFNSIMASAGIPLGWRFVHNDGQNALHKLLKEIDKNGNRTITSVEATAVTIKVCGYSWGGISAVGLAQKLSQAGQIDVGGSPGQPITYTLQVPIRLQVLLTIDPVSILNPPGNVPSTVDNFSNFYQRRGGDAIFRKPDGTIAIDDFGSVLSRTLKGVSITSQATSTTQTEVNQISPPTIRKGIPFSTGAWAGIELWLHSNEVNHDVMPWFTTTEAISILQ